MMTWETRRFSDAEELAHRCREAVAAGLTVRVRRDDTEQALAWLDRLGQARSDWLPSIGMALVELGADGEACRTAVADFFATARIAPALIEHLDTLMEAGFCGHVSARVNHRGGFGPAPIAPVREALAEIAMGLVTPSWMYFDCEPTIALEVSTPELRRAAVADAVAAGRQRTAVGFDRCTLGWLRHLAFFAEHLRPEVVGLLAEQALGDDPRGWFCFAEYIALAHDRNWLRAVLDDLVASPRAWAPLRHGLDEPPGWPAAGPQPYLDGLQLGPNPTLGAVVAWGAGRAAHERQTAPRPSR